jgi:molybdenum cofactor cytidylyltransferase
MIEKRDFMDGSTAAVILAAGSSSRMGGGRHKLLLPLDGRPVLAHVIEAALASQARPIVVVLGHQAEKVRAEMAAYFERPGIIVVENRDYLQGMSTSMRAGLGVLIGEGKVHSALIMLGDQPLITARVIDTLIDTARTGRKRIVAPLYGGKRGGPTLFGASFFGELMEISGDEGGRKVLEKYRKEVVMVELGDVADVAANYDVDTWEAYQEVLEAWQRKRENRESRGE